MKGFWILVVFIWIKCGVIIAEENSNKNLNSSESEVFKTDERNDEIHIPKDYDPRRQYPFILNLHGYGSNGKGQLMFFPMKKLAEKYGFIFCAPDGIEKKVECYRCLLRLEE